MKTKRRKNVWLIILILVSIAGQVVKGLSAEPNVTIGERTISFPADYSMGVLSVRDWGSTETGGWTILGEARGEVTVPAGKELRLKVPPDYSGNLSPLAALGPYDLQELHLEEVRVGDAGLENLKQLTSLKSLNLNRKQARKKSHPFLGKPLGDLKFTSIKGEEIDIAQYKGKVVLVDFWAVWCGPCVSELPNVKKTYSKYHGDGFEIIGISLDRDRERLEKFIQKNDMPWPQYFDGKGWDNEISTSFDIHSIPSTFLLDGQGIVRYVNLRGAALERAVAEVLEGPSLPTGQITDAGLAHLKGLTSLETLHLENTQVGDEGLAHLKGLTKLQKLNLRGTRVSNAGLTELKQALPNCSISGPAATKPHKAPKPGLGRRPKWSWDKPMPLYLRILIGAIAIPIVSFLGAVFLKIVTRWTVKFSIPYWTAYKIEIIAAVIGFVIRVPFDVPGILWALLLSFVVHLLVNSIIYGQMIKHPDTNESIGFGKGLLIWFYLLLIWIPLAVVLGCALVLPWWLLDLLRGD